MYSLQYDQLSKETGGTSEEESQRQELMEKIRNFGHFATTKIAPKELDLESKSEDTKPEQVKAEPLVTAVSILQFDFWICADTPDQTTFISWPFG